MTTVPRIFCVTLRETPKRKEEAIKYFKQVGLKAEIFEGIHGESFGLKSTIPNYNILPGREYFITSGHVGCILSHLMLWNVLINQPEDEFFIIEDDIVLCDDFFEKFAKFKLELPSDWEMAYVGWLPLHDRERVINVSDNVVIPKPVCTHAYLVRKSALKILIETNQLAWYHIDLQIIERSLPKLKYYASKTSLVTQKSINNVKEETWHSQCYDWDLDLEWANISNNTSLGTGWYPLEKNTDGYMIWSDGRGEFLFEDKWKKMEINFIVEGEIEQKIRIVCPNHPDQIFNVDYGVRNISFSVNDASSIILVSDTFRPMDIYKTSDARRLGIRLLKGITLTDASGKSSFISLHSMYGVKKTKGLSTVSGTRIFNIKHNNSNGKINISNQILYDHHRSGWEYVLNLLSDYHRDDAILFDTWLERSFAWDVNRKSQLRLIPYREPWIGVFHNPPNTPNWFTERGTPYSMIQSKEFQDSLPTCKGIYVLSKYHEKFLKCFIKNTPVETLYLPTEIPELRFNLDNFIKNTNKKVVNIGWWCRKLSSIYQLDVDKSIYQKIRLYLPPVVAYQTNLILEIEKSFRCYELTDEETRSVIDVRHLPNDEYDKFLSENVVFLDMYDTSANNIVVECIVRGTPILINPLPAVKEYLGEKYPFYFTTLDEASKKLKDIALIKTTHEYMVNSNIKEKVSGEYFMNTIKSGNIWKSL